MSFRTPMNLGGPQQIGRMPQVPPDMMAKALQQGPAPMGAEPVNQRAGAEAYQAALAGTPGVESGNVIEAIAAALQGGFAGRAANQERQREDAATAREDKREEASRNAFASALEGYDPSGDPGQSMAAMIEALRGANPEAAFGLAQQRMGSQMDMADALSLEEQRTPLLAQRQQQVGDIQTQQAIEQTQGQFPYTRGAQGSSGSVGGRPPPGYRWTPEGDLEAIPGGPAAFREGQAQVRMDQRQRAAIDSAFSRLQQSQMVLSAIGRARALAQGGETGAVGETMRHVPGTRAYDLHATLETIRSNIGFDALAEMRANSPTGGALGNVTERELALLQSIMDSLDQGQSTEQFNAALTRLEQQYTASMARIRQAYEQDMAASQQQAPAQQQPGVRRWTPEGGLQ